jgi:dCTP deaminase
VVLADVDIVEEVQSGRLRLVPFDRSLVREASICLTLSKDYLQLETVAAVDLRDSKSYPRHTVGRAEARTGFTLPPGAVVLGATRERVQMPRTLVGRIEALSGLARLGLHVALAGHVGPGFGEHDPAPLTLELTHALPHPIQLYPGMRICHLVLARLEREAQTGYDSDVGNYSRADGPAPSRFYTEFDS